MCAVEVGGRCGLPYVQGIIVHDIIEHHGAEELACCPWDNRNKLRLSPSVRHVPKRKDFIESSFRWCTAKRLNPESRVLHEADTEHFLGQWYCLLVDGVLPKPWIVASVHILDPNIEKSVGVNASMHLCSCDVARKRRPR